MATPVNPPPFLKIPKAFLKDREVRAFIEQQNIVMFQLWRKLGGNDDPISDLTNTSGNGFNSQVQWMQKQINGLPEFTVDTTGFTTDTTLITTDKAVA
jgi:hypothetical protein